jgi:hypothetical protein
MPREEVALWLNRFSFNEEGAVLIEEAQDLETQTALLSTFAPSNTIH